MQYCNSQLKKGDLNLNILAMENILYLFGYDTTELGTK